MPPRKRTIEEIHSLAEPRLSTQGREHLREGIDLFNTGRYWHAHEAWEHAWLELPEGPDGDGEIVLRGLIQLTAALHLQSVGRLDGAASNLRKAREKLALAPARYMDIDFMALREFSDNWRSDEPPQPAPAIAVMDS